MGVYFMDPVISRISWFCTLSMCRLQIFDADDSVVDPYSRCGRIALMYTFVKIVSAHWFPASFILGVVFCSCCIFFCAPHD